MKRIAIIPARSGSKGLPDKNIKELCGKPLMAWTIEAALKTGCFDEVMVSTDSDRYAEIAENYGASVPFLRSAGNSNDTAGSWDVVREVFTQYEKIGKNYDVFCMLQPTSPLRGDKEISEAIAFFDEKNAESVVSVCGLEHPISICNSLKDGLSMDGFYNSNTSGRRQDALPFYRINGAIYIQRVKALMNKSNLYGEKSFAYVMDKISSVDIDDEVDFVQAEALMHRYRTEQ